MQTKLLNEIVFDIVGKSGGEVLPLLIGKKDVNEFLIAKKLKLTINQVRNILYRLSNYSLVTFTRKKDKKKGWYTYFWTLDNEKALELLYRKFDKEVLILKHKLKSRETKRFYACETCKTEISEETSLLHNFICQECGQVYKLSENKKILTELTNSILKLEKQRGSVAEELEKIKHEKDKKLKRQLKKEEKEKIKIRKAKKKLRDKKNKIKKKVRRKMKNKKTRKKKLKTKKKKQKKKKK